MKIKRGRLQQIIQEELSRVLKEESNLDYKKVFMVVAKPYGKLEFWPNMLNPRIYDNDDDAGQVASSQNKPGASRTWYPLSVSDVLTQIGRGHDQYGILVTAAQMHLDKGAASDNDLDTDNDGQISVGELEAEIEDIKDDVEMESFEVMIVKPRGKRVETRRVHVDVNVAGHETPRQSKEAAKKVAAEKYPGYSASFAEFDKVGGLDANL